MLRSAPVSYPEAILYFSYSCTIESGYEIRSPFTSQPCSKSYAKKRERVKGKGKRILNLIYSWERLVFFFPRWRCRVTQARKKIFHISLLATNNSCYNGVNSLLILFQPDFFNTFLACTHKNIIVECYLRVYGKIYISIKFGSFCKFFPRQRDRRHN